MPLIYACIAPHAGDLIDDQNKITLTRQSMTQMGAALQALSPEIIVLINPHGFRVQGALSIAIAERATAEWSREVKLDFEMNAALANAIADQAAQMNTPSITPRAVRRAARSCWLCV